MIGHVKSDNRMDRNYLKGVAGDMINAILAAAGYNMRKLIAAFLSALIEIYEIFVRLAICKAKVSTA